jgi:hypothetical protein
MTSEVISDYLASSRDSPLSDLTTQLENFTVDGPSTLPPREAISHATDAGETNGSLPTVQSTLPVPPPKFDPSISGISSQSIRTSSFAMSDVSESNNSHLESLRIRKMYSVRSPRSKVKKKDIPSPEPTDYSDEKAFENTETDRFFIDKGG